MKRVFSGLFSIFLLIGVWILVFNVQPAKASGTTYIRADGSIDPPTAPVSTLDNVTYTLTGNITSSSDGITVERDNVIIDGNQHTVQGPVQGPDTEILYGIALTETSNVTVKNTKISNFTSGIYLNDANKTTISGNNIANNLFGISPYFSSNVSISGNNIAYNLYDGVYLGFSSGNSISGNNITGNGVGIDLHSSSNNSVSGNNIANNVNIGINLYSSTASSSSNSISGNNITNSAYGIRFDSSSINSVNGNNITDNGVGIYLGSSPGRAASFGNKLYHNNFNNNIDQVQFIYSISPNVWDYGYPSGGNYWSDSNLTDLCRGTYQNETGSDEIGDAPYTINQSNLDRYPLMNLWHQILGDVNFDGKVGLQDLALLANAYSSKLGDAKWNFNADINDDGKVDTSDLGILALHYGQHYP
jgi:parallel beta-helix repeat protein